MKTKRPSRERLLEILGPSARALSTTDVPLNVELAAMKRIADDLAAELLALQHGMEELEREWRDGEAGFGHICRDGSCCADELQKLREG